MREGVGRRPAQGVLVAGTKVVGVLFVLGFVSGAIYEQIGARRDGLAARQVGQSIDIGGRTLNVHCSGDGGPTVIFDGGRLSPGYVWTPAQRGVASFAKACWYDRAGLGWSERGPDPSWGDAAARDLHSLVRRAGLDPPFVLVGASFGGYVIRLYHHAYPGEVAGMVFVDAAHEDAGTIEDMPHRDPPPIPRWLMRGLSVGLGYVGAARLTAPDPGPPLKDWSADEWELLARLRRHRLTLLADAQHGPEVATANLVRATAGLDNMPMIVLTQGRPPLDPNSNGARVQRGWIELQKRFAERSALGRQVVVAGSGHAIPIEAPESVTAAVREIVTELRKATARR